jgi:hypothetical protein
LTLISAGFICPTLPRFLGGGVAVERGESGCGDYGSQHCFSAHTPIEAEKMLHSIDVDQRTEL